MSVCQEVEEAAPIVLKPYTYMEEKMCQVTAEGRLNMMMRILHERIDINCRDAQGYTPMHHAALNDQFDAIKLLVCNKAQVNATNWSMATPLHLAARKNHLRCAQLLVFVGADVTLVCQASGCTPRDLTSFDTPIWHFLAACEHGEPVDVVRLFELPGKPLVPEHAIPKPEINPKDAKKKAKAPEKSKAK